MGALVMGHCFPYTDPDSLRGTGRTDHWLTGRVTTLGTSSRCRATELASLP